MKTIKKGAFRSNVKKNRANMVTFFNMTCGCYSLIASINGQWNLSVFLIILSAIGDRYDGKIARKFGLESNFGLQLDSMSDLISFGVAPPILIYTNQFANVTGNLKTILGIVTTYAICCAGYRLAKYNDVGLEGDNNFFRGVPSTISGALIALSMLFRKELSPIHYGVILLVCGTLMISKFKIKKL